MSAVLAWVGDAVAVLWWLAFGAALAWGLWHQLQAERRERERQAQYPLANRYQRDGWRP